MTPTTLRAVTLKTVVNYTQAAERAVGAYPRGAGIGKAADLALTELPWGRGEVWRQSSLLAGHGHGKRIAILAFGSLLHPALAAAEKLDATVANMRFAKPLDAELVAELARSHDALVTLEVGCIAGGAGSAVGECLVAAGLCVPLLHLGLPDEFIEHGEVGKLLSGLGLDAGGIEAAVRKRFVGPLALVKPAVSH